LSAQIAGIAANDFYVVLAINDNGQCLAVQYEEGSIECLWAGKNDIYGIYWQTTKPTGPLRRSLVTECNGVQHFDIHYISIPGEDRKPYSAAVVEQFNHADAVDWTTRSFKADKVNVVQDIIAHGQGLNDDQLAAISERLNQ